MGYGNEAMAAVLRDFYGKDLFALLVDDRKIPIEDSTPFADVASLELPEGGGYTRKGPIILPEPKQVNRNWTLIAPTQSWEGSIDGFGPFTKVVYVCHGNKQVGDPDGYLLSFSTVEGSPYYRSLGQSIEHTVTLGQGMGEETSVTLFEWNR